MAKRNSRIVQTTIRPASSKDSRIFLQLIDALADFEKLKRPSPAGRKRLLRDGFGKRKRFDALLAFVDGTPVGYAIVFETYSSFLALPTLYLEDIFILPEYRRMGVGLNLFLHCVVEAKKRRCGRMEWTVLDWNRNAIRFYEKLGAQHLKEWFPFRLEREQIAALSSRAVT